MKKSLLILMMALFSAGVLSAQYATVGLYGFSGGAGNNGNSSIVLGQAFAFVATDGGYEVSAGLAQAQLDKEEPVVVTLTSDQSFNHPTLGKLKAPVTPGNYNLYAAHVAPYKYDKVKELTIKLLECTGTVEDYDHNVYEIVGVGGYCWTKSNLKAQHYYDGTEIPVALIYNSAPNNDEDANLVNFGRLYTWYSAVRVPENDNTADPTRVDGYVQGLCPTGWHIPTALQLSNLTERPTKALNTPEFWLTPNDYNNSTGFSAHGAGLATIIGGTPFYSNLLGWTEFWSDAVDGTKAITLELSYFCANPKLYSFDRSKGLSVRCVRTETGL